MLLADEPTTALDATVQIQILLLLRELQREFGMAVIFVTHDIGVAVEISDRIAVMYAGRIVESGTLRDGRACPRILTRAGCWASTCMAACAAAPRSDPRRAAEARPPADRLLVRAALQPRGRGMHARRDRGRPARASGAMYGA